MINTTTVAIIPARGGSKGIPGKNIINVGGKPLIGWSIDAALASRYIDEVVVSSDCNDILEVASKYGASTYKRPEHLASDTATTESVIDYVLTQLDQSFDNVIVLQPTSPRRRSEHIDEAITLYSNTLADSLISVYPQGIKPFKSFLINSKGFLNGFLDDESPFKRRQDLPETYYPNGAIYIVKMNLFLQTKKLLGKRCVPYIMDEFHSLDIDTLLDIQEFEQG